LEPSIRRPPMRLVRRFKIAAGHPRSPDFQFAWGFAVPRSLASTRLFFGPHDSEFDERSGPSLLGAHLVLLVRLPFVHVALQPAHGGERRRLGHAPQMEDLDVVLVERSDEALRRSGAAAENTNLPVELPSAGMLFEFVEHAKPNRRNAAGECDMV